MSQQRITYRTCVVHRGAYSATTAYVPLDECSFGTPASTYRNRLGCTGIPPTIGGDNANWVLVSAAGAAGAKGDTGAAGALPVVVTTASAYAAITPPPNDNKLYIITD